MATRIPEHLVDFLESGGSILVGTRDARMRPDATRACGAVVSADRRALTVYLADRRSQRALANLRDNGEIAVGFSRPTDNFTCQIKGTCTELCAGAERDRALTSGYHAAFVEHLYMIGLPRSTTKRLNVWPAHAVTFDVRDIFIQTPGPNAGARMETP